MNKLQTKFASIRNRLSLQLRERQTHQRVILLFVPSTDIISGGIMSVISIYRELKELEHELGFHVFLSTHPQAPSFPGYTKHNTDIRVFGFYQLLQWVKLDTDLLLHAPGTHLVQIIRGLEHDKLQTIKSKKRLTYDLNVLNQNPDFFPSVSELEGKLDIFRNVTQTTAHYVYNKTNTLGDRQVSSSYLGTPPGVDTFELVPFEEKADLLLVSHDEHPLKEQVLASIAHALPQLEIKVVQNMPFTEYMAYQRKARFGLTFGEGMDAYFVRCFLFGGLSFAVYNPTFFTEDIRNCPTVFDSWDELQKRIVGKIETYSDLEAYRKSVTKTRSVLGKYYHYGMYRKRLRHLHENWTNGRKLKATREYLNQSDEEISAG